MQHIGVIGAGAWGTALAATAARSGRQVTLWARREALAQDIAKSRENARYLPGIRLPEAIRATANPHDLSTSAAILVVTPAQKMREILALFAPVWPVGCPAVICCKGIEQGSLRVMSEVAAETLPQAPIAILSGPTFAAEVARGLPAAVTLACADQFLGAQLVEAIGTRSFRPYLSDDVAGAQMGGAVKNVLAIAAGIIEGLGLGDNARAALLTRGLAEITRLALAKGGRAETLMGLSGLGDLVLTATSQQSRNFSLGYALGQGQSLHDVLEGRNSVSEGVWTALSVADLAAASKVDMPICSAMRAVLHEGASLDKSIEALLARPFRSEQ